MLRRTFVKGIAATSLMTLTTTDVVAKTRSKLINNSNILTGNEFFLDIDYTPVNITGKNAIATTVNGQIAGPTLVWNEGETVTLHVTNH